MTEALSFIRPSEVTEEKPALGQIEPQSDSHAVQVTAAVSGNASNSEVGKLRCSFCRADLDESLELTIAGKRGHRGSTGSFCSAYCRNCVLALAALHPSPLAPDDFVSKRGLLTDRLLVLWRRGMGPDPELVLRAAERAGCGIPIAGPAVPIDVHAGAAPTRPLAKSTDVRPIERSKVPVLKSAGRANAA